MAQAHKGDIGTKISIDMEVNVATATTRKIKYRKPQTGTVGEWTAVADGTTAIAFTTTVVTDLNEVGYWQLQGYVELPTPWKGHTVKTGMDVLSTLEVSA